MSQYHHISALIPPFTGNLSNLGSYIMLRELSNDRDSVRPALKRALIALATADIIYSVAIAFTMLPTPHDQSNGRPYAHGTIATCQIQGFFAMVGGIASPLFTVYVSYIFLMTLRYQHTDQQFSRRQVWVFASIWLLSLVAGFFPIPMSLYSNAWHICWLNAYPAWCHLTDLYECQRGENFEVYSIIFLIFPVWPCMILVVLMLIPIWTQARKLESRISRYGANSLAQNTTTTTTTQTAVRQSQPRIDRRRSGAIALQATLYVASFFFSNILRVIVVCRLQLFGKFNEIFAIIAMDVFLPLQGFFNGLLFCRNRTMLTPEGRFFKNIIFGVCSKWCSWRSKRRSAPRKSNRTSETGKSVIADNTASSSKQVHDETENEVDQPFCGIDIGKDDDSVEDIEDIASLDLANHDSEDGLKSQFAQEIRKSTIQLDAMHNSFILHNDIVEEPEEDHDFIKNNTIDRSRSVSYLPMLGARKGTPRVVDRDGIGRLFRRRSAANGRTFQPTLETQDSLSESEVAEKTSSLDRRQIQSYKSGTASQSMPQLRTKRSEPIGLSPLQHEESRPARPCPIKTEETVSPMDVSNSPDDATREQMSSPPMDRTTNTGEDPNGCGSRP